MAPLGSLLGLCNVTICYEISWKCSTLLSVAFLRDVVTENLVPYLSDTWLAHGIGVHTPTTCPQVRTAARSPAVRNDCLSSPSLSLHPSSSASDTECHLPTAVPTSTKHHGASTPTPPAEPACRSQLCNGRLSGWQEDSELRGTHMPLRFVGRHHASGIALAYV